MRNVSLRCGACGAAHAPDMHTLECRDCGGPLDVEYTATGTTVPVAGYDVRMPFHDAASMPSLGEGDTPVVGLAELGGALGLKRLDAKLEYMNPTGSYKDRGTVVMLAVARELGVGEVVEDSSGNAGASVSAYSARAGIRAHIFAPATAPAAKLRQIRVYGAEVHSIEGPREAATEAAVAFSNENDLVYASHAWSPFFFEGTKTFAFETARHYGGRAPRPHRIPGRKRRTLPRGVARLHVSCWTPGTSTGFRGSTPFRPPTSCPSPPASWAAPGTRRACSRPWRVAYRSVPRRAGHRSWMLYAGQTERRSPSTRSEISAMQRALARDEGIFAEPTSAAAFAGVRRLMKDGVDNARRVRARARHGVRPEGRGALRPGSVSDTSPCRRYRPVSCRADHVSLPSANAKPFTGPPTNVNEERDCYEILEEAAPGDRASRAFDIFLISLITLNAVALIVGTVEEIHELSPQAFLDHRDRIGCRSSRWSTC